MSSDIEEWEEEIFSEVIEINDYPSVEKGETYKAVGMADLARNKRKIQNWEEKEYSYSRPRFRNGQTLMARITPCLENGKTAYADVLDDGETAIGSTEFIVLSDTEKTIPKFVYYTARRPEIRKFAIKRMTGTSGRQRVPIDSFDNKEINLPPLEEQKRIVEVLDNIDSKIETNNRINEILEELAQTLFKSWFVDYEPYENFKHSELGEIPKNFEVGKVSDFGKVVCGGTPSKEEEDNFGGDIPFITVDDIEGAYVNETEETLSEKGANSQESKELNKDAVCVSCVATIGKICITKERCHTNQQINSIVSEEYSPYFIYFYMKHASRRLEKVTGSGSTYSYISKGDFSEFNVLLPPPEKANEFGNIVEPFMERIDHNQRENEKLQELRDTLLPKLMSGELRVEVDEDE